MPQRVFLATSEVYPFSKTGGLGDVMGALPAALHESGLSVSVISPFYGRIRTGNYQIRLTISDLPVGYPWGPVTADVYEADYHGVRQYFIHRGEFFDRRYYYNDHKGDYFDNAERFIFFCRAAMSLMERLGEKPDIVHCHDWQSSLLPIFISYAREDNPFWSGTGSVMTIHNLAFQGRFSSRLFVDTGLPVESWGMDGVEFYGDLNMLKGGIAYADAVTTVSPSYANEILTETFGCGLDGVLRTREKDLYGVLNGADYVVWNPEDDPFLSCRYSADNLSGKRKCKADIMEELGLNPALADRPLLGFIGRLRGQKGIDLLNRIIPDLMELNVGVIVLGEGNLTHEAVLLDHMESYRGRLAAVVGYTEDLAHRMQAASDIFLMPSRYEPCGLTQMYALRYGTPPVGTAVGGLRDTITPWPDPEATGFIFTKCDPAHFLEAITQAVRLWTDDPDGWTAMMRRAMRKNFSWSDAGAHYKDIYANVLSRVRQV